MTAYMQALPLNITVFGNTYQLVGYSLHHRNHFTCVLFWNGKGYYYDGLKDTDKLQLIPFKRNRLAGFRDHMHTSYSVNYNLITVCYS